MNTDKLVQNVQHFLYDKHNQKKLLKIFLGIIVISSLISFFGYFTFVRVSFSKDISTTEQTEAYVYQAIPENKSKITSLLGVFLVPRAADALLFVAGDAETFVSPRSGSFAFGYENIVAPLSSPGLGNKISSGGTRCPIINSSGVYSHECNNPSSFKKYTETENQLPRHESSSTFPSRFISRQYKDGVLSWYGQGIIGPTEKTEATLAYVTPEQGAVNSLTMPNGINDASQNYIEIITDSANPENSGFVVYNHTSGQGFYYADFMKSASPKKVNRLHSINLTNDVSSCTLVGTSFACYHGSPGEESHNHAEEEQEGTVQRETENHEAVSREGVIEVTDMSEATPVTVTYQGSDGVGIAKLYATSKGTLFGSSGYELHRIELEGASFSTVPISKYTTILESGSSMFYTLGNKLYAYDETNHASVLLYHNQKEIITKLVPRGNQLLVLSYHINDPLQLLNIHSVGGGS